MAPDQVQDQQLPRISAITPTFGRAFFLRQSLAFFKADVYPEDRKEWIILDSTPSSHKDNEPHRQAFLDEIKDIPWIKYFHLPDRENINPAYDAQYPDAFAHIRRDKAAYLAEVDQLIDASKANPASQIKIQFQSSADPKAGRPSIGEKRNVACSLASGDIIIHRDDDDYYGPQYNLETVQEIQKGADFIRWADFYVYMVAMNLYGSYEFDSDYGCYRVSKDGDPLFLSATELKDAKSEGSIRKEGHGYGLLFAYTKDSWQKTGGFAPLFTEEDVLFVPTIEKMGGKVAFPRGLTDRVCRVIHGNSTSSRVYMVHEPAELSQTMLASVSPHVGHTDLLSPEVAKLREHLNSQRQPVQNTLAAKADSVHLRNG
jgi:hypothetical protein